MLGSLKSKLNFFRIHLLLFILIPLVLASIFHASNGRYKIKFIDALFVCVSAATGTGLITFDLSSATAWQQVILVMLELFGNQVFVSWLVVLVRRLYFLEHLGHIVAAEQERDSTQRDSTSMDARPTLNAFLNNGLRELGARRLSQRTQQTLPAAPKPPKAARRSAPDKLHAGMVRRVDVSPHRVDPAGRRTTSTDGGYSSSYDAPRESSVNPLHSPQLSNRRTSLTQQLSPVPEQGGYFGGYPGPFELVSHAMRSAFPRLHRRLRTTVTMPRTETLIPGIAGETSRGASGPPTRVVPYLSFWAIVGRNSTFRNLSKEEIEELGGVEYRALSALLWIVPLYYLGLLAISFAVIAPYMCMLRWRLWFLPPEQHRKINPIWFSAFQVVGAWANTGMSLVDQNMTPFRTAYPMIIFLVICVLAGNTFFTLMPHTISWILMTVFPHQSRTKQTLQFLLDHPRRCFIYMFPSNQTWLLFAMQFTIDLLAWSFDLLLNVGNPAFGGITVGVRIINAVLAAAAVRSAGFQSIAVSTFVPAVQVLFVILMYIAIYPIAISIRSTNVYEERSLGIYESKEEEEEASELDRPHMDVESRVAIWGRYLVRHARRQLSFDMWWLALSLFLLCIIERTPLMNTNDSSWFNIFALIFELVSAYGTVGLSLGIPNENYSFSGALHTLSKLIMCAVMIRGRHRSLPVALDRAVLLPHEFLRQETRPADEDVRQEADQNIGDGQHGDARTEKQAETPHSMENIETDETTNATRARRRKLSFAFDQPPEARRDVSVAHHLMKVEPRETAELEENG
ncbi:TrkH-domain-containing protein [Laetiporus sulphureus 93-53]|uniref:TrkH-domain-containing protein n=1 Tax=Laetiporus sulphureus 93-53 TaxID=1314785 RepID=A0A165HTP6_9APHY|nr:TrkH-domain-containing protein [Laetiporus sulphureus 93-53]KZT12176.1 TrkH-domain-containing protein [Laetiporus sulphureus 93-53]